MSPHSPSLDHFTRSLTLPFLPSLPTTPTSTFLSHYRTLHHRSSESFTLQTIFIIQFLKKLVKHLHQTPSSRNDAPTNCRPFRIGILIPDIAPETGEFLASTVIRVWKREGIVLDNELHVIKRPLERDTNKASGGTKTFDGVQAVWGWGDPNFLSTYTLLLHLSDTLSAPLITTYLRTQTHPPQSPTVFIPSIKSLTLPKLINLYQTDLVILPSWNFEPRQGDETRGAGRALWTFEKTPKGFVVPDLDRTRTVFINFGVRRGLSLDESARLVRSILPDTVVESIDSLTKLSIARSSYAPENVPKPARSRSPCPLRSASPAHVQ